MNRTMTHNQQTGDTETILVIACGALAREVIALREMNGLHHLTIKCLPAKLHNSPKKIPDAVRAKIHQERENYNSIFVAYGDCGTGGALDSVLEEEKVSRIGGAHCYAFYAGLDQFEEMHNQCPGTFYLTDFLVRHFETLVVKGMGLDRYPQLRDMYFGNYQRLMYLAQTDDDELTRMARLAAQMLGLEFDRQFTGFGEMGKIFEEFKPEPRQ